VGRMKVDDDYKCSTQRNWAGLASFGCCKSVNEGKRPRRLGYHPRRVPTIELPRRPTYTRV
jgi:hypothetical protein